MVIESKVYRNIKNAVCIIPYIPVFFSNTGCCYYYPAVGGWVETRSGQGSRNDVLTTCKMVTLHGGKRITALFFHSKYFN